MSNARKRFAQLLKEILEIINKYKDLEGAEYDFSYQQLKNTVEATLRSLGEEEESQTK